MRTCYCFPHERVRALPHTWVTKCQGHTAVRHLGGEKLSRRWDKQLPLGAGISVTSVANLCDAFKLRCDNGIYTSRFEDALY